ncbi:hypothetical protein QNI19_24225 [Cytophagaceae bacterium DM2B3-1]|uniref:Uncharacterized protein n=1 Tax=Xanthocytophaga flava TaxID=3048013 RepID=A0ABT7CQP6_9BACT|nr:hypothetical protein [Xanthocytophaga flavus]MDJ1496065.1 hypothetical protein [Xanthocytophaga flavus]
MIKLLPYCILFLFLQSITYGQVSVGFQKSFFLGKEKKNNLTEEELKAIRSSTLIFFYKSADESILPQLEKALKSSWKVTPLKLVPFSQIEKYLNEPNYSYATLTTFIDGSSTISGGQKMPVWYLFLDFWINKSEEKIPRKSFAWVCLSTGGTMPYAPIYGFPLTASFGSYATKAGSYNVLGNEVIDLSYKIKANKELIKEKKIPATDNYFDYLYNHGSFHNWTLPDLKAYFSVVNNHVQNGTTRAFRQEDMDVSELSKLKKDTLFIPEYALLVPDKPKKDTMIYKQVSENEIKKILAAYPYPYQIVSEDILVKKIMDPAKSIYYLSHIVTSAKIVAIINSQSGKIIYTDFRFLMGNECIRTTDMTLLKEAIEKGHK